MKKGQIYIISTGTGNGEQLTLNALNLLKRSELIVGYSKYIDDIKNIIANKKTYSTGMTKEVDRCKYAINQALQGITTTLISNGDANVYGMAGLVLEIIDQNQLWNKIDIFIEPGVSSIFAAAAKAGAPIMSDFAVISLSNLLTPLEKIKLRLEYAFKGDFVAGIYNPLSHSRKEPYEEFLKLLKAYADKNTPVVIAKDIGRPNEKIIIKNVSYLLETGIDLDIINMSTIIIIGNSSTKIVNDDNYVITQRGYQQNYDYKLITN